MATVEVLSAWLERLVGIEAARTADAVAAVRGWRLEHIERELFDVPDLDTLTAAVLLVESVETLVGQGVQRTKLLKKLRDARASAQFWPAWAEIRSAAILVKRPEYGARIELEPDAVKGRHADFRLHQPDERSVAIEFKAVGLSDAEVAWHRAAAAQFNRLLPPVGLTTVHGRLGQAIRVGADKRRRIAADSKQRSDALLERFPAWAEVHGVAIVGHEAEEQYLRRASARFEEALGQLPVGESWLGLWSGNGAPLPELRSIRATAEAPPSVAGVVSIGQGVAVPWSEIHVFIAFVPREEAASRVVDSSVDNALATRVLERFESSAGVRATLLRAPGPRSAILLRRDGSRRLFSFQPALRRGPTRAHHAAAEGEPGSGRTPHRMTTGRGRPVSRRTARTRTTSRIPPMIVA